MRLFVCGVGLCLGIVATGSTARAQAWVGGKGEVDASLDYNLGISDKVVGDQNVEFPDAGTTTHQITLAAEYVPIEHLAVEASLPMGFFKYTGSKTAYPHPGGGRYDDGSTHATLTDLRAAVRYQVLEDPLAISPYIGVSIPVAGYETVGNTVAGRHLKALHFGAAFGRLITDELYIHASYEFSWVEKYDRVADTAKYGQNHSDAAITLGYKLLDDRLDVNVDANMRITHDGVNFSNFANLTPDEQLYHDAILRESIFLVGAGLGYQLTDAVAVSLAARFFVGGVNTQNANVYALGLAWRTL